MTRVLLIVMKRLQRDGGKFRLCGLNATVREVLEISGFSTLFEIFDDRAQATDGF